jgi:hypothetical protein
MTSIRCRFIVAVCLAAAALGGCANAASGNSPSAGCRPVAGPLASDTALKAVQRFVAAVQQHDQACITALTVYEANLPDDMVSSLAESKIWEQASMSAHQIVASDDWMVVGNSGAASYQFTVVSNAGNVLVKSLAGTTGRIGRS